MLKTTHPEKHTNRILQRILVNIVERTLLLQLVWPLGDEHFNTLVFKTLIVVCSIISWKIWIDNTEMFLVPGEVDLVKDKNCKETRLPKQSLHRGKESC